MLSHLPKTTGLVNVTLVMSPHLSDSETYDLILPGQPDLRASTDVGQHLHARPLIPLQASAMWSIRKTLV